MNLAWHIFRKDWRILWPLAVATMLLQVLVMMVIRHSTPFPMTDGTSAVAALLTFALVISMTLLIVLTVQQEAIPSIHQDWLTRPVARGDLLLAKLLALLLLVHGPIVTVNVLQGLAEGFPLGSVLHATLNSNFEIALCYSLPAMAVAAMTRSVVQAIIFGLAVVVVVVLFGSVFSTVTGGTGLKWIWRTVSHVEILLATIIALCWQYFSRSRDATLQSRAVFAGGVALFALIPALPWNPAFSFQHGLAANPAAGRSIAVAVEQGASFQDRQILSGKNLGVPDENTTRIAVPLRFAGVPAGILLHADRTTVRLVRNDGSVVYRGVGHVFDLPAGGDGTVRQAIDLPAAVYAQVADHPLRLELEYFATLLRGQLVSSVPLNVPRRVPGFGWCAVRDAGKNVLEVGCREIGALPFCVSMAAGRGPEKFVCELNYEPVPLRFSVDPIDHVEVPLPLDAGLDAAIAIRVYEPEDHFSRKVVVPQLRLREWILTGGT